ncbi:uncharacterized protein Pyn_31254 [Prunus yedoensis var. nudiflora]|uniref:Uncharacterized protein n=1 Tax=Prunus yedoensis var. nudiflora TaxID=2094558 RepID=A0A314YGX2_PRUYE|nr:uncharacterized protein Pyn_31254 [Prunus yedoensis var. nudiflora]
MNTLLTLFLMALGKAILEFSDITRGVVLNLYISDKLLGQDRDKLISNLNTIQDYLCSFNSKGSTVLNLSATTFNPTLDWLHGYLLEHIEQGISPLSNDNVSGLWKIRLHSIQMLASSKQKWRKEPILKVSHSKQQIGLELDDKDQNVCQKQMEKNKSSKEISYPASCNATKHLRKIQFFNYAYEKTKWQDLDLEKMGKTNVADHDLEKTGWHSKSIG